ncbi:MAG: virulence RhuM family protein [Firmicutes bacterium]|nr:virulence RhuM family protein [Bacillota bacterium]
MQTLQIRNSTAEFLIFTKQNKEKTIEVIVDEESVWLSQKLMAELFGTTRNNITMHLSNIFEKELSEDSVCKEFLHTARDEKNYKTKYYNLDAIIAVGFKVNSKRAIDFRLWAINILKQYSVKGYVLDKERLKNGTFLNENYFDELLQEIREIRISERNFYQKITDIYTTSLDYNVSSPITKDFFKTVQNKMHYAVHGNTAAEVIVNRANHKKAHMGLTNWKNSPNGKIIASDVIVAKNYLTKEELKSLERIVTMYLDYAEDQAERHIPMTMEDWKGKLDVFLQFNERDVLDNPGKVSHKVAESFALSEFEKYRITQDKLFESDFDKFMIEMENEDISC